MYTAPHIWMTVPDDTIGNLHAYKSQLSHMNRCVSLIVLQTKVDAPSDKLSTIVQQVSDLNLKFALRPHHMWMYGRHPICGS